MHAGSLQKNTYLIFSILALCSGLVSCGTDGKEPEGTPQAPHPEDPNWYRSAVFYEIFPRSFRDTNGDGIGDLKGIQEGLPYLADLGIGALWLTPIYPTPFHDSGYDVADYVSVNPDYGTMKDLEDLVESAHRHKIRVILDMVFNHTSDQHPWFQASRSSRDNTRRDWYVWADPPFPYDCYNPLNFQFGRERWTLDPGTGQYYFHNFRPQMPELNFLTPEVRDALLDVASFWLEKGVDGFRLDVAHMYYEGLEGCAHLPETHAFLQDFRRLTDQYPCKTMVGEVSGLSNEVLAYLGRGEDELHMIFNFPLVYMTYPALWLGDARWIVQGLKDTYCRIPKGGQMATLLGNHDFFRIDATLPGDPRRLKLAALVLLTFPGTPFMYYGDEIGMANGTTFVLDYRDAARTPMHWDMSPGAGFTSGTPWIPLSPNWSTHNVALEKSDEDSLLNYYRMLIHLRNVTPALREGEATILDARRENPYLLLRGTGRGSVLVLLNLKAYAIDGTIDLTSLPWSEGLVCDILTGDAVAPLTEEDRREYPYALEAYQGLLLQPCDGQ